MLNCPRDVGVQLVRIAIRIEESQFVSLHSGIQLN